jgi:hypothetical protein
MGTFRKIVIGTAIVLLIVILKGGGATAATDVNYVVAQLTKFFNAV